jgi:glycosyltransferase involved in cell wall biosynthesis
VDARKISVIPHGAVPNRSAAPIGEPASATRRPTVLTWGLIGPGKGIEWAIDAFAGLADLDPAPRYLVAGQTHPKVLEHQGEAYRDSLRARAAAHGISASVEFDDGYRDVPALLSLVRQADIVLLPYDATEQATSGVLIEAVAACRPVVATQFPHATELLATGAGLLVPQKDAAAMSAALRRILTEPALAASMTAAGQQIAPTLDWSAVADAYHGLADDLRGARAGAGSPMRYRRRVSVQTSAV